MSLLMESLGKSRKKLYEQEYVRLAMDDRDYNVEIVFDMSVWMKHQDVYEIWMCVYLQDVEGVCEKKKKLGLKKRMECERMLNGDTFKKDYIF